jgi:hypothetical protein
MADNEATPDILERANHELPESSNTAALPCHLINKLPREVRDMVSALLS